MLRKSTIFDVDDCDHGWGIGEIAIISYYSKTDVLVSIYICLAVVVSDSIQSVSHVVVVEWVDILNTK